jgi:AraC-like DNA-binding protein
MITTIAMKVGYTSLSAFNTAFQELTGQTPPTTATASNPDQPLHLSANDRQNAVLKTSQIPQLVDVLQIACAAAIRTPVRDRFTASARALFAPTWLRLYKSYGHSAL